MTFWPTWLTKKLGLDAPVPGPTVTITISDVFSGEGFAQFLRDHDGEIAKALRWLQKERRL